MDEYLQDDDIKYLAKVDTDALTGIVMRANKHAMHLYRLLGEGLELLTTGIITFPRPDAQELLAIRQGDYTYDQLMEKIGATEGLSAEEAIDSYMDKHKTDFVLPRSPHRKEIDNLCQSLVWNHLVEGHRDQHRYAANSCEAMGMD